MARLVSSQFRCNFGPKGKWDRANNSKEKGDPNVFRHFPKLPNWEVCTMTKTKRARCKHRRLKRAGVILFLTTLGELVTADLKILDLDSARIVHDGTRTCYRVIPTKRKNAKETASFVRKSGAFM